jgi:hopanoid biosynthesis associated protein HpnK
LKSVIIVADDFGISLAVNEAVEAAHRHGILSTASLMVGAPAAADAVARAKRLPNLRVGLHLNLVDGRPVLPSRKIPALVRGRDEFDCNLVRAGVRFFFLPRARRELAREIRAQFAAFHATGLTLDHVNAHKHMHLHPTVAGLVVEIGRDFGIKAMRVPAEPVAPLRRAFPDERFATPLYKPWIERLRRRLRRAGLVTNDQIFGLAWSGAMSETRILGLLPHLPEGVSEIYFHPTADGRPGELAALLSPAVARRLAELGVAPVTYSDLTSRERALPLRQHRAANI